MGTPGVDDMHPRYAQLKNKQALAIADCVALAQELHVAKPLFLSEVHFFLDIALYKWYGKV